MLSARIEPTFSGSSEPAWKEVVESGWKMETTRSGAKVDAGRTKELELRESKRGSDAIVPYWVETSVARDGRRLRKRTIRRV